MKKYIFVALAAICLSVLFSCSSRVPVVNNKDTYTIDTADNIDTKETYQIDTEDNPVTEDVSVNETNFDTEASADAIDPNAVGGENFDELKLKFSPPLGVIGGKPGDMNFVFSRTEDVTRVIAKFEKEYPYPMQWCTPDQPPLMYILIREMPLTREEVELYSQEHDNLFSEEMIDALFNDDLGEAMRSFLSPYNFYCDGGIYTFYHFYELVTDPDSGYKVTDFENYEEVLANVYEYMYLNYSGKHQFIMYYPTEMVEFVEQYIPEEDHRWIRYETDNRGYHYRAPEPVSDAVS